MPQNKLARITGVFYLLIIAGGLYSGIAVRGTLVDLADPAGTIQNIIQHQGLYKAGFLSDLVMVVSDVVVSVLFFMLLKTVNLYVAVFATVFRLIQSSVLGANLTNLFAPLLLVAGYAEAGSGQQEFIVSSVMHQLDLFEYGYLISGVFFSFNCFLMGYLVYNSGFIPRIWGVAIAIAGLAYLSNCLVSFTVPALSDYTQLFVLVAAIFAELGLCLFLLIKGTRSRGS